MPLTLAGRPAAFKALSAIDMIDLEDARAMAADLVVKSYPELEGLEGEPYRRHPKRPRFLAEFNLRATIIPCILTAWSANGSGEIAPDAEAIAESAYADVVACCHEIRRLNPFLEELPEAPAPPKGEPAPNA